MPVIFVIRLIRPLIHFRFGFFVTERIGHFTLDVGLALAESDLDLKNCYSDWYFLPRKTCNQQWAKMTRRELRVRWWVSCLQYWNKHIPGGKIHQKNPAITTLGSRDKHGWFNKSSAQKIPFLPKEDAEAKSWLRKQGWQDGEPFVCLAVRDSSYLSEQIPGLNKNKYSHHNYRDSDISTYVQATEYLAEKGIWVLRMGKVMKIPIPTQHPKIIDYAFHSDKNDLLDIWLFANCMGCISTGTGMDSISKIYGKQVLYLNFLPLTHIDSSYKGIWVPKKLIWKMSKEPLSLRQYLANPTQLYKEAGIEIVDLSSEEIFEAVQEFLMRVQGDFIDEEDNVLLQKQFWATFKDWENFSELHDWVNPDARVGTHYLRKMGYALF